jgi:hypothetical protein
MEIGARYYGNTTIEAIDPYVVRYSDLNDETKDYIRKTASTITYMSICLSCIIWQIITATMLAWRSKKWIHFMLLIQTILCFLNILCSVLNPTTSVSCVFVKEQTNFVNLF